MNKRFIDELKFDSQGLIPAVIQDSGSGQVLMMAWMNRESVEKTVDSRKTWFYSRSRQVLWCKGESSGNVQEVDDIYFDCDADCLLVKVRQNGAACHTGHYSCFYRDTNGAEVESAQFNPDLVYNGKEGAGILYELMEIIAERRETRPEGSYTTYLFNQGLDKILKKVGEECAEVIIASKNRDKSEVIYEVSDLFYHTLVLMTEQGVELSEIFAELKARR